MRRPVLVTAAAAAIVFVVLWVAARSAELGHRIGLEGRPLVEGLR